MFCSLVSITDIRECPLPLFRRLLAITVLMVASMLALAGTANATPALGTITSIAPSSGPVAGDTTVTILGTDLYYGTSGPAVTIGGNPAPVTSWRRYGAVGETEVIVTTPAGTAGAADVRVRAHHDHGEGVLRGFCTQRHRGRHSGDRCRRCE